MTWWRSLSVLLCILTALVSPRTASAASAVQAETRVKEFFLVATAIVGGSSARTVEKHPGKSVAYDENASGSFLAVEGFSAHRLDGKSRRRPRRFLQVPLPPLAD